MPYSRIAPDGGVVLALDVGLRLLHAFFSEELSPRSEFWIIPPAPQLRIGSMEPIDQFWRELAACREEDSSLFFAGGEGAPPADVRARARAICAGCPVRDECLDYALEAGPRYGIWGGLTQDELRVLRRRLRRAS